MFPLRVAEAHLDRGRTFLVVLMYVAVLFWCVPWIPASSIPLALLLALCLLEREALFVEVRSWRVEIMLVLLILALGVIFSRLPEKSLKGVYDFLRGAVFFFPVSILARHYPEKVRRLFWPTLVAASVFFLAAAFWVYWQNSAVPYGFRRGIIACFRHYNIYGTCTALVAGLSLVGWLYRGEAPVNRWPAAGLFAVAAGLTVLSGSRGSTLALLVMVCVAVGCRLERGRTLWFAGGGLLLAVFLVLLRLGVLSRLLPGWNRGADFTSGRFHIYRTILDAVWDQEKWFGFGINSFKYLDAVQPFRFRLMLPHSVFFEAWFSLGILGCLLVAVLLVRLLLRLYRRSARGMLYHAGLAIIVFYLARGLVDMKLFSQYYPAALAFGFGLMQGAGRPVPERAER